MENKENYSSLDELVYYEYRIRYEMFSNGPKKVFSGTILEITDENNSYSYVTRIQNSDPIAVVFGCIDIVEDEIKRKHNKNM